MRGGGLLESGPGEWLVDRIIESAPPGPSQEELENGFTRIYTRAEGEGRTVERRLRGPEAYVFTARSMAEVAAASLEGESTGGFQTPSTAFGTDFVHRVDGVEQLPSPGGGDEQ